jgi:hypothetical protein
MACFHSILCPRCLDGGVNNRCEVVVQAVSGVDELEDEVYQCFRCGWQKPCIEWDGNDD